MAPSKTLSKTQFAQAATGDRHFPKFLFHKEHGARKFTSQEHLDTLGKERENWFNSPGEADAGEENDEIAREGDVLETGGGRPLGYESKPYPKFLFFKDGEGIVKHVKVNDPDAHEALGDGYHEHPDDIDSAVKKAPKGATALGGHAVTQADGLKPEEKAAFYGAPEEQIVAGLKMCGLKDVNDLIVAEAANPSGPRLKVIDALQSRREDLGGKPDPKQVAAAKSGKLKPAKKTPAAPKPLNKGAKKK